MILSRIIPDKKNCAVIKRQD